MRNKIKRIRFPFDQR